GGCRGPLACTTTASPWSRSATTWATAAGWSRCCRTTERYSRAYLRHLLVTNEPTAGRIITLHNLAWLADLVAHMRTAIVAGTFNDLRRRVWAVWAPGEEPPPPPS
ncbi:MAG: hypothetical protein AAGK32_19075, partial [Actinomycetota bacterium]